MLFTLDLLPFTLDPVYLQATFGLTPLALHLSPYTFHPTPFPYKYFLITAYKTFFSGSVNSPALSMLKKCLRNAVVAATILLTS